MTLKHGQLAGKTVAVDVATGRNVGVVASREMDKERREAFAAHAHAQGFRVLSRGASGNYIVPSVQRLWEQWVADGVLVSAKDQP